MTDAADPPCGQFCAAKDIDREAAARCDFMQESP